MLRTTIHSLSLILVALGLVACAQKPVARLEDSRLYNVRYASIIGDQGLPVAIVAGVQKGIDQSIASTFRSTPSPEVVLNAKLSNIETVPGPTGPVAVIHINTALTDARNGQLVAVGEFQVGSAERSQRGLQITLRDGVASQLRYAYGLQTPVQQPQMPQRQAYVPNNNDLATYAPNQPLSQEQLTEKALQTPDAILNEKTQIDTSSDPALAPGMGGTQPKTNIVKPKKNKDLGGLQNNRASVTIPATGTQDPNSPANVEKASAAPDKPIAVPAVKATSNLENGAATKIVIPAGKKLADPAATATDASSTAAGAAAAAAPVMPTASDEPCVVTVTNDCKTPATK